MNEDYSMKFYVSQLEERVVDRCVSIGTKKAWDDVQEDESLNFGEKMHKYIAHFYQMHKRCGLILRAEPKE